MSNKAMPQNPLVAPPPPPQSSSPNWGSTTKMVVGLTVVALILALLFYFRNIIGPLILAFVLAYLLYPVADRLSTGANMPWRTAVNLIYLLLVIVLGALVTFSGIAIVQQVTALVITVQEFITNLPQIVADLSSQVWEFGPFRIDFNQLDLDYLANQILGVVQPLLGELTRLLSTLATSAASALGWILFVLLVSYFLLADAGGAVSKTLVRIDIPGYSEDVRRLTEKLRVIWNSFLRGQLIIILIVVVAYTLLMMILGVRYSLAIAILAGLARFVPYLGPLTAWIVLGLVTFFQPSNYFGLQPLHFTLLAVVSALVLDQIFDNMVTPRLLGSTLGVHPAAVLVAAIIATNLIGLIGLLLAAPVLATLQVVGRYVIRKMFDLDPWPDEPEPAGMSLPWSEGIARLRSWLRSLRLPR